MAKVATAAIKHVPAWLENQSKQIDVQSQAITADRELKAKEMDHIAAMRLKELDGQAARLQGRETTIRIGAIAGLLSVIAVVLIITLTGKSEAWIYVGAFVGMLFAAMCGLVYGRSIGKFNPPKDSNGG